MNRNYTPTLNQIKIKKRMFFLFFLSFFAIKAQNLSEIINKKDVFLVDVRSAEEFENGSAENAVNIPIDSLEKKIDLFKNKKDIVVFCLKGIRAEKAQKKLAEFGIKAHNGKTFMNVKSLQKTPLLQKLTFTNEKPTTFVVKNGKNIRQVAIALGKNAVLKKHTTAIPATLLVLKGSVSFEMENEKIILNELDSYQIPVDVVHQVVGLKRKNIFVVTKGE